MIGLTRTLMLLFAIQFLFFVGISGKSYAAIVSDIRIDFTVEDPDGNPVKDVRISYFAKTTIMGKSYGDTQYHKDGKFSKEFKRVINVNFTIFHKDYFLKNIIFGSGSEITPTQSTSNGALYLNQKIVLEPEGDLAKLREKRFTLQWHSQNGSNLVLIDELTTTPKKSNKYLMAGFTQDYDTISTPRLFLALRDSATSIPAKYSTVRPDRLVAPEDAYLELVVEDCGTSDGFIIISPPAPDQVLIKEKLFAMQTAPEDGYTSHLSFENLLYPKSEDWYSGYFFYCRLNGYYGKGMIEVLNYYDDKGGKIRLDLRLNLDGTRNLRSAKH